MKVEDRGKGIEDSGWKMEDIDARSSILDPFRSGDFKTHLCRRMATKL